MISSNKSNGIVHFYIVTDHRGHHRKRYFNF